MKRAFLVFSMCAMLFLAAPAFGDTGAGLPPVILDVVRHREFFAHPGVLWGCGDCSIYSVKRIGAGWIGAGIIMPSGFAAQVVYDAQTLDVLCREIYIPAKSRRGEMRRQGVSVAAAKKLAGDAVRYAMNSRAVSGPMPRITGREGGGSQ